MSLPVEKKEKSVINRELTFTKHSVVIIARSSNGRTTVFGTVYRGSNPCRAADS